LNAPSSRGIQGSFGRDDLKIRWMMNRPIGAVLLALGVAAMATPALAQPYSAAQTPDDQVMYRPPQVNQAPLPPPNFAAAPATAAPAPVTYGHQFGDQPAVPADPGAILPPASVGGAPAAATAPQPLPSTQTAALPPEDQPEQGTPQELPPNLQRQLVDLRTTEPAGTIIIDTDKTYLYLVLGHGKAIRYGIGVGREGFTWSGTERISRMAEWPDWHPPAEMIERQPYLPRFMAGGPGNPLGARALYLGHTLYRIHGTNQPSTIGKTVSSGCIRLLNNDIEDLYSRVQVGTRVVVLPASKPAAPEAIASKDVPGGVVGSVPSSSPPSRAVTAGSGTVSTSRLPPPR
jgi:lipoprotein-anchoring transpeptidase ErfK/SrfK